MKVRSQLTAAEVEQVYRSLEARLDRIGLETQPEVAVRILDLVNKPDVQIADYARVIRTDAALSGRLLRLANSAFFAQVTPVTSLDRACVLLGVERLRAFSLGFYLSRAAASDVGHELSRRVWGESVFRGCLASSLARRLLPDYSMEAFVVGLMLDAGVPLMYKLVGSPYLLLQAETAAPPKRHHREFTTLGFTHVDVITTLARRWKLPPVLARPLAWHHTPPGEGVGGTPEHVLHRIVYYVGAIDLDRRTTLPREAAPMSALASKVIGCDERELTKVIATAAGEYKATMGVFSGLGSTMADLEALPDMVHVQLSKLLDETLTRSAAGPDRPGVGRFKLGGCEVDIVSDQPGWAVAYLVTAGGERLASHRFIPGPDVVSQIRHAFSLEVTGADEERALADHIRGLAA